MTDLYKEGCFFLSDYYFVVLVSFFIFILLLKKFTKTYRSRHNRNIRKGRKILKLIRSWGEENKSARIFSYLRKIDPFVFEELLLESFKLNGFLIKRNERYSGDGGIDGIVYDKNNTYFVQAKRYKNHINRQHLIEFKNLVERYKVSGFFIHTGKTGKACYDVLNNSSIKIISGSRLINLLTAEKRSAAG